MVRIPSFVRSFFQLVYKLRSTEFYIFCRGLKKGQEIQNGEMDAPSLCGLYYLHLGSPIL